MSKYFSLLFFAAVLLVAGIVVYRSIRQAANDPTPGPMDIALEKLRTRNPRLTFEPVGNHGHAFWITDPRKNSSAIVSWKQSEDALIELLPCMASDIPAGMLYPRRSSDPVCLRVTTEDAVLTAFSFHSPENLMYDAAAFYEGSPQDGIRGTEHEQTGRSERLQDGTSRFLYSYYFFVNPRGNSFPPGLAAFVGYRKEKRTQ